MVTLKDVASAAGVSVTTVSYAMTGRGSVSAATRRRIRLAAQKLGYTPNRTAQAMRTGRSGLLGLLVADLTVGYHSFLVQHVERAARAASCLTVLMDVKEGTDSGEELIDLLLRQGVDGVIWALEKQPDFPPEKMALLYLGAPAEGFDSLHWRPGDARENPLPIPDYSSFATEAVRTLLERIEIPERAARTLVLDQSP